MVIAKLKIHIGKCKNLSLRYLHVACRDVDCLAGTGSGLEHFNPAN